MAEPHWPDPNADGSTTFSAQDSKKWLLYIGGLVGYLTTSFSECGRTVDPGPQEERVP